MVEVQPVVFVEIAADDLGIPKRLIGDTGVGERHRHGIIPRRAVGRRVDGDLGRLLQEHRLHVGVLDFSTDLSLVGTSDRLERDASQRRLSSDRGKVGEKKRAAPVIQEPLRAAHLLQSPVRQPIGPQMIRLGSVHRHQKRLTGRRGRTDQPDDDRDQPQADPSTQRPPPCRFSRSNSRRASGTTALRGLERINVSNRSTASSMPSAEAPRYRARYRAASAVSRASG